MKNPLGTMWCVRVNPSCIEPAIPPCDAETMQRYIVTRELEALKLSADAEYTLFQVQRLSNAFLTDVLGGVYPLDSRRLLAFRAACHMVVTRKGEVETTAVNPETEHTLQVYDPKLAPNQWPFVAQEGAHGVLIAPLSYTQEVVDLYSAETIQEIGQVAIDFARLPKGKHGPFTSWGGSVASL